MTTSKIPFNVHSGAANRVTTLNATSNVQTVDSFSRYTANGFVIGRFNLIISSSATATWTGVRLGTGLPKAPYSTICGVAKIDGSAETVHISAENDSLYAVVRGTPIAGTTINGYFMYPSTEAYSI